MFLEFFLGKSLVGIDIIRTFASAFAQKFRAEAKRTSRAAREKQVHLVFRVVKEVKAERH